MQPWRTIDRVETPEGPLELRQRGERDFLITISGRVLMTSAAHRSEDALAEIACRALPAGSQPRVLAGGLGGASRGGAVGGPRGGGGGPAARGGPAPGWSPPPLLAGGQLVGVRVAARHVGGGGARAEGEAGLEDEWFPRDEMGPRRSVH